MAQSSEVMSRRARVAAQVLWRALIAVAGLHVYWVFGGSWGVHATSGGAYSEPTTSVRVGAAVVALVLVVGSLAVCARAGLWRAPVSDRVVRAATWVLAAALALAALQNFTASTDVERFVIAPFVLVLALLAFVVAGSGREWHVHRPHRTLPSH